jgi:apolipoprotein N-acyltransferase
VITLNLQRSSLIEIGWGLFSSGFSFFLLYLSQPPGDFPEAAYFFLLPFLIWLNFKPEQKSVLISLFVTGVIYQISLLFWIRHVSFPGLAAMAIILSSYNLPWYIAARKLAPIFVVGSFRVRLTLLLGLSSLWVAIEWARGLFSLGFPWCPLSVTQWERPALLQLVPYFGGFIVSFFLIFFNLCLASYLHHLLVRRTKDNPSGYFSNLCPDFYFCMLFFLLMLSPLFIKVDKSHLSVHENEGSNLRVGICQPYLKDKWISSNAQKNKNLLIEQTKLVALQRPDVIFWPEASTPFAVNEDRAWVEELSAEINIPLLIGSVIKKDEVSYNSVVAISPSSGLGQEFYAKQKLVPFGEFVPFPFDLIPGIRRMVGPVGDFEAGVSSQKFSFLCERNQTFNVHPLICYEDIFPSLVAPLERIRNSCIFVTTNDAWFGEEGCAEQHAAHSVFRALESGMPVIRCGNAGWSGWISPKGVIVEVLQDELQGVYFAGASVFHVSFSSNSDKAFNFQQLFPLLCVTFSFFCFAFSVKKFKKINNV